ncbi:MAG: hypothetical protein ACKV19_24080 [Verrucomicrobiales bacterium]
MPGLFGIITRQSPEKARADLERMAHSMHHEAHYRLETYANSEWGLYVGRWALPRAYDDSPFTHPEHPGRMLAFSGEHFGCLKQDHAPLPGESAAELFAGWAKNGIQFIRDLNGWFSGVLVDENDGSAVLFNDRYGMGRLYIHEGPEELLFASEAKALLAVRPHLRRLDRESVVQHLGFYCAGPGRTLFEGVSLLPNAALWIRRRSGGPLEKGEYFSSSEWENLDPLPKHDFLEAFDGCVDQIVPQYTSGRRECALSLTGGFDTRLVMAALDNGEQALPSFTFDGPTGEIVDVRIARRLANAAHCPHTHIRLNTQYFSEFESYARRAVYIADGMHDAFGAHDVFFNERAREIAPVRLTGKFGSEVVRIRKLIPKFNCPTELLQSDVAAEAAKVPRLDRISHRGGDLAGVVFREIPAYEFGRVAVEQSQLTLRTPYMDNRLVRLMFQAPPELRGAADLQADYIRSHSPRLATVPTNLGGLTTNNQLLKRLVYLFYRSCFKLEYYYLHPTPHWFTRIDRRLPWLGFERVLAGKQKLERYRLWSQGMLAPAIQGMLLDPGALYGDVFDRQAVEKIVRRHMAGTHNYMRQINKVLTYELLLQTLINGKTAQINRQSATLRQASGNEVNLAPTCQSA